MLFIFLFIFSSTSHFFHNKNYMMKSHLVIFLCQYDYCCMLGAELLTIFACSFDLRWSKRKEVDNLRQVYPPQVTTFSKKDVKQRGAIISSLADLKMKKHVALQTLNWKQMNVRFSRCWGEIIKGGAQDRMLSLAILFESSFLVVWLNFFASRPTTRDPPGYPIKS